MNKQQLAQKIWASANQMRSKIEASEYKDFILGFIFYKYLSDKEIEFLKDNDYDDELLKTVTEDDPETVKWVQENIGYFISYKDFFSTWLGMGKDFDVSNVRDALSAFSRLISPTHKRVFEKIFNTLETGLSKLGDSSGTQTKAISGLLNLIKDIPMDGKQGYDVLGFIYEYLISMFAANAGKKAGEFYTPHEVSLLMSEIVASHLQGKNEIKIYDPTSGSGSLLINIGKSVSKYMADANNVKYYAQELKENTYNLTRMNLVMRGILPDNIVARNGDTLEDDWPWFDTLENKEETYNPLFVDAVVSNPPYSQNWDPTDKEIDPRFSYGIAPKSKADYAFLLHDLYHLRADGIMTIVLPHGVLFRGGEEGQIRKNLIENRHIQAIIGLPANIFFGTGIPTIVMVLRKKRDDDRVLIVDSSKHFIKDGKNNKLQASDIKRIVDVVSNNRTVPKFSRLVSIDEIRANDYNLNIPRYVDSSENAETWDMYASMFGGVPKSEVEQLGEYWNAWPSLKAELFRDNGACYACDHDDIATVVRNNADVQAFIASYGQAISGLPVDLRSRLVEHPEQVDALGQETAIGKELDAMIAGTPLVDPYDAYQKLDDAWGGISIDLEVLGSEGFDAVRAVDPNMVIKKKGGKDVEVQDGWIGRVLPFDLVQRELLHDDLAAIEADERRVQDIDSEIETILEGFDEDDKQNSDAVNQDGDAFVAAELKKAVKAIGKNPASDFERGLVQAQKLFDETKKLKSGIKTKRNALEEKTCNTIKALSDDEARRLLEAKWITPLQKQLEKLPNAVIDELIGKVNALKNKYATTYADVCGQIDEAEKELAGMLGDLTGNARDLAGLEELKALLGGE